MTSGHGRVLVRRRTDRVALIRRQAAAAAEMGRPVAWLALALYGLAQQAPKGASPTTGRAAALMVATGDYRSGRRARPGRRISAEILGVSERTIQRHWRLLEGGLGVAVMTTAGTWLSADRRSEVYADPDERARWRDRQEWHLVMPAWAGELPAAAVVELVEYEARARELLDELSRAQPRRDGCVAGDLAHSPAPAGRPVDNAIAPATPASGRVAPSLSGFSCSYVKHLARFPLQRPDGRRNRPKGAAPRHSPTRTRRPGRSDQARRTMPVVAVELVRELLQRRRLPWAQRAPRPILVAALSGLAAAGWTARDVEAEAEARLIRTGKSTPPEGPRWPVSYLGWLLADADPTRPPARERDAELIAAAAETAARTAATRERDASAAADAARARGGRAHQATLALARTTAERAAERRAGERAHIAAERAAAAAAARQRPDAPPSPRADALCVGGCGTLSPDVQLRTAMPRPVPLCPFCWADVARALR